MNRPSASEKTVLVTGGAGFIGSHTAKALHRAGYKPVVFDSLSGGRREAVHWGPFVHGDIRDVGALDAALARTQAGGGDPLRRPDRGGALDDPARPLL